jgi:hypothetical protein
MSRDGGSACRIRKGDRSDAKVGYRRISPRIQSLPCANHAFPLAPLQPILDGILGVSLVVHSHIGFDSAVVDYFHPRKFPVLGQVMSWLLRICTGLSVWGVYEFNTNDIGTLLSTLCLFSTIMLTSCAQIGITEFVRRVWKA